MRKKCYSMRAILLGAMLIGAGFASEEVEKDGLKMLNGYFALADSLALDNFTVAKAIAAGMVKYMPGSSLSSPAKAIAKSDSIEKARHHFRDLTVATKSWIRNQPGAQALVFHCPKAAEGRGAEWLQRPDHRQANNPYMGREMPHCGKIKEAIGGPSKGVAKIPRGID